MNIVIQLRPHLDPSQPILEVETLDGIGRCFQRVKVLTEHKVWHGAVLTKDHIKVVRQSMFAPEPTP